MSDFMSFAKIRDRMIRVEQPSSAQDELTATRRRILGAAQTLFARDGYAATPMRAIADRAEVPMETVDAVFPTKGELLRQLIKTVGGRSDDALETMERDWVHEAMTDPDGRRCIALMVEHGNDIYARIVPLSDAIGEGAAIEPEVAAVWRGIVEQRRQGIRRMVDSLATRSQLREGLDEERAADIVFGLHRPETFAVFVDERGWSVEELKAWSYRLLCDQLLGPPPPTSPEASPTRGLSFDQALS